MLVNVEPVALQKKTRLSNKIIVSFLHKWGVLYTSSGFGDLVTTQCDMFPSNFLT